ncbi:hypothetical protein AYJ66_17580 [Dietzia cinnamea]|nr:hypothetical protein AYJ66_17580 [Dietzia cinnamea]
MLDCRTIVKDGLNRRPRLSLYINCVVQASLDLLVPAAANRPYFPGFRIKQCDACLHFIIRELNSRICIQDIFHMFLCVLIQCCIYFKSIGKNIKIGFFGNLFNHHVNKGIEWFFVLILSVFFLNKAGFNRNFLGFFFLFL